MMDRKDKTDSLYAIVSGADAGAMVTKDGLVAVILVEEVKIKGEARFKSTIYGSAPAVVLLRGKNGRWNITGPVDQIKREELLRLAEGLRLLAGNPPPAGEGQAAP